MKLATALLLLGIGVLACSFTLPPYTDEQLFMARYLSLENGQSAEYWKLRDEMLTPKFKLQDYGGTFIAAAVAVFLVLRRGWRNLKSPRSRATLFGVALVAPFLTVGAYIFDLLLRFERGEFPHWADSMSIPLMGAPMVLVILLAWAGAHLLLVRGAYQPTLLTQAASFKANWWLLFVAALTTVLVALCASTGQYWYAGPGTIWLFFYVSLAAVRRSSHDVEPGSQADLEC